MLDIKKIREDHQAIEKKLQSRDASISLAELLEVDANRLKLLSSVETARARSNQLAKEIGKAKGKGENVDGLLAEANSLNKTLPEQEQLLKETTEKWLYLQSILPNIPLDEVPASLDPEDKIQIRAWGSPLPLEKTPLNHIEIGEKHNLFDFKRAAKTTGSNWVIYRDLGARLEWALINYMIEFHIANGYLFCLPPHLARQQMFYGCGQLPKFADQLFKLDDEDHQLMLIPTSEAIVNGFHAEETLTDEELPIKYAAYTPCFRREAGGSGSNDRGLIRMHQFNKVEMFAFARPEEAETIFTEFVGNAEALLQGLELPYRSMLLSTGDIGFCSEKTIDIEVWLPGQKQFREVSSVSRCGAFQSRRSNIRYRDANNQMHYLHTLNGSGLATSRVMVALLENHQRADGKIYLPPPLRKHFNGETLIG